MVFSFRFLLSSATLSEDSLGRVCGKKYTFDPYHMVDLVQFSCFSATLGVPRDEVEIFFKSPQRTNVYQQVLRVKEISTR